VSGSRRPAPPQSGGGVGRPAPGPAVAQPFARPQRRPARRPASAPGHVPGGRRIAADPAQ